MLHIWWHKTLMACLHQFQRDFVYRAALTFITWLFCQWVYYLMSRYAIAFKSRWMACSAKMRYNLWHESLMACLYQFQRDFAFYRDAITSITVLFCQGVYFLVSMYEIALNSRWMASSASMPQKLWHETLMACLHQFQRDIAICGAILTSITGLLHLQGIFPCFQKCNCF